ncbi:MAG: hypothetical protein JWN34_5696 [Bryobacterales bacterium]|nr:hypothetical protein [Bryobacterales bacterium]
MEVERDLIGAAREVWESTRARIPKEGFAARLLELQDPDGQWAGGAYFPKDWDFKSPEVEGQPWVATTWTLNMLREWGVDPASLGDTATRPAANSRWEQPAVLERGG